jgi:hypothetical protein
MTLAQTYPRLPVTIPALEYLVKEYPGMFLCYHIAESETYKDSTTWDLLLIIDQGTVDYYVRNLITIAFLLAVALPNGPFIPIRQILHESLNT